MAEDADLDIDDDLSMEIDTKKTKQKDKHEMEKMRWELKALLKQPLFPKVGFFFLFFIYRRLFFFSTKIIILFVCFQGTFSPRYTTLGSMDPLMKKNKLEQKSALSAMSH